MGWLALRNKVLTFKAFSTFRASSYVSEAKRHKQFVSKLTSTSSKIATAKTSSPEFLHPIMTPGESVLDMSSGQNILISPSCLGMAG